MAKDSDYLKALADLAEAVGDIAADLEDVRDEAQDLYDENGDEDVRADVQRMDGAIRLLAQALDLMEKE